MKSRKCWTKNTCVRNRGLFYHQSLLSIFHLWICEFSKSDIFILLLPWFKERIYSSKDPGLNDDCVTPAVTIEKRTVTRRKGASTRRDPPRTKWSQGRSPVEIAAYEEEAKPDESPHDDEQVCTLKSGYFWAKE